MEDYKKSLKKIAIMIEINRQRFHQNPIKKE